MVQNFFGVIYATNGVFHYSLIWSYAGSDVITQNKVL
jgi:hypothetical protein